MKHLSDTFTVDMFEQPAFGTHSRKLVRRKDPDTSHEAAKTVDTAMLERMVYEIIAMFPRGCTAEDVERALPNIRSHSITPRFAPLIKKGLIVDTGLRKKASSGRNQRIVKAIKETT
jgi:DNA-binding PucR family transcriptional regulator